MKVSEMIKHLQAIQAHAATLGENDPEVNFWHLDLDVDEEMEMNIISDLNEIQKCGSVAVSYGIQMITVETNCVPNYHVEEVIPELSVW